MLYIKKANYKDIDKEYQFLKDLPQNENGVINDYYGLSKEEFTNNSIKKIIYNSYGIALEKGYPTTTMYFLWKDNNIVGIFKLRHYLTPGFLNGGGHISYIVKEEYRGQGLATEGLKLILKEAKNIVIEDEIYLHAFGYNKASIKVILKNGGYIHHTNKNGVFLRIDKRKIINS